jgi:dimethylaniline monooxygenase (N-oxide forming)
MAVHAEDSVPSRVDPYWNHVARTALIYSVPLALLGWCLTNGWVGASRDFWVPLAFSFLVLAPATRLRFGRPFAYKDYQNRDRFPATLGLLPACVWSIAVHSLAEPAAAALALFAILVAYDFVMLRYQLLCAYALGPKVAAGGGMDVLARFSVPLWGYLALALWASHAFGADALAAIAASTVVVVLPPICVWWLWRTRWAPPQRSQGIRTVAVVGAGWSGIYATKWLSRAGIDVTCFEATDSVGGIWKYRADKPVGTHESTRVTSSKHFLHASDFPMPLSTPEFPHRSQVLQYLESYVRHFAVAGRFRLERRVLSVDRDGTGWRILTQASDGERQEGPFDAVVICSGPHQNPNINYSEHPLYSGFAGKIIHSSEYKKASDIGRGKTVLVVGAGESSADIVAECVNEGAAVHWSVRSGQWFADRNMGPYPADHITTHGSRVFVGLFGFWEYLVRRFVTGAFVNLAWGRGGHGVPEWLPDTPYLHQFLNKSRDGVLEIYRNKAVPHRGISRISGNEVFFTGDEKPVVVDAIVLATGFKPKWPFLPQQPEALYKLVFSPDDPRLAFVGFARPIVGSIPSLSELQARWVTAVWTGAAALPAREQRAAEVWLDAKHHGQLIRDASALGQLVEQELYATDLASRFDAHVHWLKLLLGWPVAFFVLLVSPWAPFKYRLNDADREERRSALSNIIRELPDPRAPVYLLASGIAVTSAIMLGVVALVCSKLPVGPALEALAVGGLALSCLLRLTEVRLSDGQVKQPLTFVGRLREVFPF